MVYTFFNKKTALLADESAFGGAIKSMQNQKLENELHKPIIRKFRKKQRYVHHSKTMFEVLIWLICN